MWLGRGQTKCIARSSGKLHIEPPKQRARFTWNFPRDMFASRGVWMGKRCVWCWSSCWDDRAGGGDADLDRGRSDGHAARIRGAERDGADGAGGQSVFGAGVRVSRETRRSDQAAVVGRRRAVPVRETAGALEIHLAASGDRNGFADAGAVVDAAGGHRLAASGAPLRTSNGEGAKVPVSINVISHNCAVSG